MASGQKSLPGHCQFTISIWNCLIYLSLKNLLVHFCARCNCTEKYLPLLQFQPINGMAYFLIFLCCILSSVNGYSLKINPHIQTAVNTLQAKGQNNTLSFSQISNSTILNAIPSQIHASHQNELISFSVILVIFTIAFLILGKIISQHVLATYKLHLRIANLEAVYLENFQ